MWAHARKPSHVRQDNTYESSRQRWYEKAAFHGMTLSSP
jgi:hypothetical protein